MFFDATYTHRNTCPQNKALMLSFDYSLLGCNDLNGLIYRLIVHRSTCNDNKQLANNLVPNVSPSAIMSNMFTQHVQFLHVWTLFSTNRSNWEWHFDLSRPCFNIWQNNCSTDWPRPRRFAKRKACVCGFGRINRQHEHQLLGMLRVTDFPQNINLSPPRILVRTRTTCNSNCRALCGYTRTQRLALHPWISSTRKRWPTCRLHRRVDAPLRSTTNTSTPPIIWSNYLAPCSQSVTWQT